MGAPPKMNRSAEGGASSSLHSRDEGVLIHPPYQGVCGRHGTEEQHVTSGELTESPGDTGVSEPISESEMASKALSVVGRLNITYEAWRKPRYRATGDRMGRERQPAKMVGNEKGNQMSKDEGGRNSSFSEKRVRSRPRRLVDWISPTGAQQIHSLIGKFD